MYTGNRRPIFIAAIAAAIIIGTSLWFTLRDTKGGADKEPAASAELKDKIRKVSSADHVRGNPDAPLVFITYSDFGCPYCKEYHGTMSRIIDMYGKDGKVAWVFRHLPVVQLHPQSATYALASECVAEVAGEGAFWNFSDALFNTIQPDKAVDPSGLIALAQTSGADPQKFASCMRKNDMSKVERDFNEAVAAGAQGTPYTVVFAPNEVFALEEARSLQEMAFAVKTVLDTLGSTELTAPNTNMVNSESFDDTAVLKAQQLASTSTASTTSAGN